MISHDIGPTIVVCAEHRDPAVIASLVGHAVLGLIARAEREGLPRGAVRVSLERWRGHPLPELDPSTLGPPEVTS